MKTKRQREVRAILKVWGTALRIGTGEATLAPRFNRMLEQLRGIEPITAPLLAWSPNPRPHIPGPLPESWVAAREADWGDDPMGDWHGRNE